MRYTHIAKAQTFVGPPRITNATVVGSSPKKPILIRACITEALKLSSERFETVYVELKDIDKVSGHPSSKGMEQIFEQVYEVTHN